MKTKAIMNFQIGNSYVYVLGPSIEVRSEPASTTKLSVKALSYSIYGRCSKSSNTRYLPKRPR